MTPLAFIAPVVAALSWELLMMMLGAAVLGGLFVFAAQRLFDDKPVRRRKVRRPVTAGRPH